MKRFRLIAAVLLIGVTAPCVNAQLSFPGQSINPGDNVPAGATDTVSVSGVPNLALVRIEVDLIWDPSSTANRHTWIGDTSVSLTHNGFTISLFNRPGKSSATAGFGDNGNFLGTYTFRDSAVVRLIDVANPLPGTDDATGDIPSGAFRATNNLFNLNAGPTFTGEQVQTLDGSFGTDGNNNWTLFYADSEAGDYAAMTGWVLRFVPVPEPSSMLALGAGAIGLGGLIRRRLRRPIVVA